MSLNSALSGRKIENYETDKPHSEQSLLKETTLYKLGYSPPLPSPLNANVPRQAAVNRFRESRINLTYTIFSGAVWIIRPASLGSQSELICSSLCIVNRTACSNKLHLIQTVNSLGRFLLL